VLKLAYVKFKITSLAGMLSNRYGLPVIA